MSRTCLLLLSLSVCLAAAVAADAPKIDRVFPPGLCRGTSVDVKLSGKPGDGPLRIWSDRAQLAFEVSEKQDAVHVTAPADAVPGIHWLRFYNDHGAAGLIPFFVGVVPESVEAEPNDGVASAQSLEAASVTVNGVLQKTDDVDIFSLSLSAGRTFVASLQGNRDLGSPMDAVLQLLDSNGTVLTQNDDDHGLDPQIAFDIATDGQYYVRAFAFPSKPNSTIRLAGGADYVYRLTMTSGAFIDYVIPSTVDPAASTSVSIHGWNLTPELRTATIGPFDQKLTSVTEGFANVFSVSAAKHPSAAEADQLPQPVAIPSSVTGCIAVPGEQDTYTITGKKGQKLTVEAEARSLYSLLDPVITVTDESGKVLKEADDRSRDDPDAEAAVTLGADGLFHIRITDRYGDGGERYFYVLTCRETQPDVSASVSGDAFVLSEDKPLEIPVAVSRINGLAEVVKVTVEGLPEGVTAETVESAAKGDTAKAVTLKLVRTEGAGSFSGPVRIVCTTADSAIVRRAVSPTSNSSAPAEEIWLTVLAPKPKAEPDVGDPAAEKKEP